MDFNFRKKEKESAPQQTANKLTESSKVLLEPKEVEINGNKFIIGKMPCTVAQEVIFSLPNGLIPIISEFKKAEDQALKMLSYCERVYSDGRSVPLISKAIIDNHIPDFDTLIKLEYECLEYNYSFFSDGRALSFLNRGVSLAKSNVSEILTDLLGKLSHLAEQRSGNSKTNIH